MEMKRSVLVENSQAFAVTTDEAQSASKTDRTLRRRLETTRRRLVRSILGIAQNSRRSRFLRGGSDLPHETTRAATNIPVNSSGCSP